MSNSNVDFVILWVDPNDKEWQLEKKKYQTSINEDDGDARFRDWENLQYLFRGIEKFTPWVRKIHFITCGHLPKWMDVNNPKLNIIKHTDYIPEKYLPVFNSDPIELNLHRIEDLSEQFVLFNDDMFLLDKMNEKDFFENNLPKDSALLNVHCYSIDEMFTLAPFLNIGIINKYFDMKKVLKGNFRKWYSIKYGLNTLRNLYLLPCPRFPGMRMDHLPCSHLKSTFEEMWRLEYDLLDQNSANRFRNQLSINHWLMKEWNMVSGNFTPRKSNIGKSYIITDKNIDTISQIITSQKRKMACLNDGKMSDDDYKRCKKIIIDSFNKILPNKSGFEI